MVKLLEVTRSFIVMDQNEERKKKSTGDEEVNELGIKV